MCEGGGARVRQEVIKNRRRGIGHALVEGLAGGRGPSSSHPHTVCLRPTFGYTRGGRGGGGGGLWTVVRCYVVPAGPLPRAVTSPEAVGG